MVGLDFSVGPFDLATLLANGNHGVALFFSLSGFLLSLPYWRAIEGNGPYPELTKYFRNRIIRIVPAYYVILSILIFASRYWKIPGTGFDIVSHYLFVFNFTEFGIFSISPQFWTLAVEIQFYLLLPFLFLCARVWVKRFNILIGIGLLFIICFSAQLFMLKKIDTVIPWPYNTWLTWIMPNGAVINHSLVATFPHFLLGVIAGGLYNRFPIKKDFSSFLTKHSEKLFSTCMAMVVVFLSTDWIDTFELS